MCCAALDLQMAFSSASTVGAVAGSASDMHARTHARTHMLAFLYGSSSTVLSAFGFIIKLVCRIWASLCWRTPTTM